MDSDYKKYSLEQLDNWVNDALTSADATPQEIYDVIKNAVTENYHYFKHHAGRSYELLALLNANGEQSIKMCDKDDPSPECKGAWNDFWEQNYDPEEYDLREEEYYNKNNKVVKWQLPVQVDGLTGDCYVNFPDDLLEAVNLKEGDKVKWIDNGDGSFKIVKVNQPLEMDDC